MVGGGRKVAGGDGDKWLVGEIEGFDLFEGGSLGDDLGACAGEGVVVDEGDGFGVGQGAGFGEPAGEVGQIGVGGRGLAVAGVETDVADGTGIAVAIFEGDDLGPAVGVEQEEGFGPLGGAATFVAEACVAGQTPVEVIDEDLAVGEEGEQVLAENACFGRGRRR